MSRGHASHANRDENRLFAGLYPCGVVYADRKVEVAGDYKRLAFLRYADLSLQMEKGCPTELEQEIRASAADLQKRKGEQYQIAGNMSVVLGSELIERDAAARRP